MSVKFAILLCAGEGRRLGLHTPKAFVKLKNKYIFEYSLEKLSEFCDFCVITLPQSKFEETRKIVLDVLSGRRYAERVFCVRGGKTRHASVLSALNFIETELSPSGDSLVVEHDGARPFFSRELLRKLLDEAEKFGSAVPFVKPPDTVRVVKGDAFEKTLQRDKIALIQTPQVFKFEIFLKAFRTAEREGFEGTDGAGVVERLGIRIRAVEGERYNIKITYPEDLAVAELLVDVLEK